MASLRKSLIFIYTNIIICDALGNLVQFVQFVIVKNTHGGASILVKLEPFRLTLVLGCFPCILNCTNGTKSRKASRILLICDFNSEVSERSMHDFCNFMIQKVYQTHLLVFLSKSTIGLLLTNSKNNFDDTLALESGLSDSLSDIACQF